MTAVLDEPRAAGRTLQAIAEEVERIEESKADFIADTRKMGYQADGNGQVLTIDDVAADGGLGIYGIRPVAHEQIALHCGIPKTFYDRLRNGVPAKNGRGARKPIPELLAHNVETIWREQPAKRMVRTLDGKARAFLSNRYRRLDHYDLMEAILPTIAEMPSPIVGGEVTERRLYITVALPKIQADIRVGDPVQAGFIIQNSEVGLGALSVQMRVFRLVCKNGMIAPDYSSRKYHVGKQAEEMEAAYRVYSDATLKADDAAFFMKVRDVIKAAADETKFKAIAISMRELTETEPMADPVGAVERLGKRLAITEGEQKGLLSHLVQGGDLTAYGALNAVTRLAQDAEDFDRRIELEKAGGQLLGVTEKDWAAIAA